MPETNEFLDSDVSSWILANMGILFIFHLLIFLIYISIKIFSFVKIGNTLKNILTYLEFTFLIVFFLIFHMQIFVFIILNLHHFSGTNFFLIMSLLIAIGYLITFVLFWIYSAYRMLSSRFYFEDPQHKTQFYYYFLGYKESKPATFFDLWKIIAHFFIAVMIGSAYKQPVLQTVVIFLILISLVIYLVIFRPFLNFY